MTLRRARDIADREMHNASNERIRQAYRVLLEANTIWYRDRMRLQKLTLRMDPMTRDEAKEKAKWRGV